MSSFNVPTPEFIKLQNQLAEAQWLHLYGRVSQVVGLVVEVEGPAASIGDVCFINSNDEAPIVAEVVGFRGERLLMMPFGDTHGIGAGCVVRLTNGCLRVPVGTELLGRVLNGIGQPVDNDFPLGTSLTYPILAPPPNALNRQLISSPFWTGVRAIDSAISIGIGQRVGIFAGSGVGKSTLLGMVARYGQADVNVIALVGERGREVREFIENDLGQDGLRRSVVVYSTSDEPSVMRIKAAFTATAIAEYFRDQGLNVMLMMDSVTRFATAQREIGLAIGEPPSTKGYTPSVFGLLPKLMERTGCNDHGAITALYTILVEGDDTNEPIADATRSILDGHIVLDRKLSNRGHYPPIDLLQSLSRVMPMVVTADQIDQARILRELISAYDEIEDLVSIGAYKPGSKPLADLALSKWDAINKFLRQRKEESSSLEETLSALKELTDAQI